jgi:hypothetical protein
MIVGSETDVDVLGCVSAQEEQPKVHVLDHVQPQP